MAPISPDALVSRATALGRLVKSAVVFLIVVFHLGVLLIRNPLDLWYKPISDWIKEQGCWDPYGTAFTRADAFTYKYVNLVGCEQAWNMFSPPMARNAPFLGFCLEFTTGDAELVRSEQEPADPAAFVRFGGWQRRKHEDYLMFPHENLAKHPERGLWEAYARFVLLQWRRTHPNDPRTIARVVFVRRRIAFPGPDEKPGAFKPAEETTLVSFDAEGRLLP